MHGMNIGRYFYSRCFFRQEILLSTISEKDAIIGSLEYDRGNDTKSNQLRIHRLNEEKDYLHQQLKDLVNY